MALKKFKFNVIANDKFSRIGLIKTSRGNIQTPAFMPVGTKATVKAAFIDDIIKTGSEIILCNTYHLMIFLMNAEQYQWLDLQIQTVQIVNFLYVLKMPRILIDNTLFLVEL